MLTSIENKQDIWQL